jgi:ElaB/YqjD/DUF883 family membrane-anchored ribosome-binding protein
MTDRPTEEQERELTQTPGGARTASAAGDLPEEKDQEQLQQEIEETRAELGDTVDALAQKADVKARVSEKVEQRKAALRERQVDIKARVNGARERVSRTTPDEAKRAASQVARTAEERPFPAIAVALGLGLLIGRAIGRR